MAVKSSRMIGKDVTASTPDLLKELVNIYRTDMVVIAKQYNVFDILFNAQSNQFTKYFALFNVKIIDEDILFDYFFN